MIIYSPNHCPVLFIYLFIINVHYFFNKISSSFANVLFIFIFSIPFVCLSFYMYLFSFLHRYLTVLVRTSFFLLSPISLILSFFYLFVSSFYAFFYIFFLPSLIFFCLFFPSLYSYFFSLIFPAWYLLVFVFRTFCSVHLAVSSLRFPQWERNACN